MPSPEERTFSLPVEQADYIDTLVASGSYASGSEPDCGHCMNVTQRSRSGCAGKLLGYATPCSRIPAAPFPVSRVLPPFAHGMPIS